MLKRFFNGKRIIILLLTVIIVLLVIQIFVSRSHTETCSVSHEVYTSNARGCDKIPNCGCLHKGFFGFGPCDSCQCVRYTTSC